jgi:hypothetical protein
MKCYPAEIEIQMQRYYQSLSEKDRRRYAAIEAVKLGYGGLAYMSRLFGCHSETLQLGMSELQNEAVLKDKRIRQCLPSTTLAHLEHQFSSPFCYKIELQIDGIGSAQNGK